MFSPGQFVSSGHLKCKPRTDPEFCSQKFCAIPVVLHFLLDLLPNSQLLVLLVTRLLIVLRHRHLAGPGLLDILRKGRRLIRGGVIRLLADSRRGCFFLLGGFLGLFCVEARRRERGL